MVELPYWLRHPKTALYDVLPSRREVEDRLLGTQRGRIALVGGLYAVLGSIYLSGALPYPAFGEEGYVAYYALSSTERGALAYMMLAGVPAYYAGEKAIALVYSPDENVLRVLDPEGEIEETWILGDETLAEMDVVDGTLATRRTRQGKIWYCVEYKPDENVARATWEGTVDAGQTWATKQDVARCINETQDRARDADRLERRQPEIVRKSVRAELARHIERLDDIDPIVSGEGYKQARADVLGVEYESEGGERDEEIRRQRDDRERKNGDADAADDISTIDEAMTDGVET